MPNNTEPVEIRSEQVQDILTKMPHWLVSSGSSLLLAIIGMIVFISWFVKYPDTISTEVMLTSQNPPEKLYAATQGKFDAILVTDGENVVADQVLGVMQNSAIYEDYLLLKAVMDSLPVSRDQFYFPIDQLGPLVLGDLNSSYAQFENDYNEYYSNKLLNPYQNESFANHYSKLEAKNRLSTLLAQRDIDKKKLELQRNKLGRQKELYDEGVIAIDEFEGRQIELYQAEQSFKTMETSISQINEFISNSERTIKNGDIKNTQNKSRLLKKTLQSFFQLKKSIKDWERQFLLKSSIDGKVSFLNIWNKNQTANMGDLVFTIIPSDNESYIGKITAPPSNSGKIKPGQKVQIKLAKYPADEYGELNATVTSISLTPDNNGNYRIDVAIPKELKTTYGNTIAFSHEMKGQADIVTEDLRLVDRFFYQLKGLF